MAIIGFIATVGGTLISYYAFIQPADLSADLSRIAERLAQEPVLEQDERLYVGQVLDMGASQMVYLEKQATNVPGSFNIKLCEPTSGTLKGDTSFSFGKEATSFYPQVKAGSEINILISAKLGSQIFERKEEWRKTAGTWTRVSAPEIATAGTLSCK
ncbi:hypothetical protein [Ancylobacter radicis]|uniref:Uncharacterized protein n=1 Tax=Ancylobacter radicis TaxID=2836179 RepID=A0ABS5R9F3_9HYPH|nr:hypothetical protein [Ancylobacter radicis]MBS9478309.1 hypothetical protein [Ancylobacter radicis]